MAENQLLYAILWTRHTIFNQAFFLFFVLVPSAAGSRSYQKHGPGLGPVQRSGRRLGPSGSARCIKPHPGLAHRHVPVPAGPGRVQPLCDRRLAELHQRRAQAAFAGAGTANGALRATRRWTSFSLRQRSTAHPLRSRARKALARRLSRAQGRWLACVGRRCAEPLHPARPRRGGARHRAGEQSAPPNGVAP